MGEAKRKREAAAARASAAPTTDPTWCPTCLSQKIYTASCEHMKPTAEPARPETTDLRKRALALFKPPFRYEMGYVWDAAGEMVADNREDKEDAAALPVVRVRGWGRIKYLPEPDALHDEAGRLIAEALTKGWPR